MGVCGLHTTVAELDQSSISVIVATRVGTDYIALIIIMNSNLLCEFKYIFYALNVIVSV